MELMKKPAGIEKIEVPVPFAPGSTNCFFIPGSTPTLIDPGVFSPEAFQILRNGLREFGSDIGDIRRIILTHGHADHAGLAGAVAAHGGAAVFVHRFDENRVLVCSEDVRKEKAASFRSFFEEAGVARKGAPAGMTQYEILRRLFLVPSGAGALFMGISEVRGCLEVMEKEGVVAVSFDDCRKLYRLNG